MDEGKKSSGFKINDHRRFDTEGNDRSESVSQRDGSTSTSSEKSGSGSRANPDTVERKGTMNDSRSASAEITFTSFVMSLATQALMQLGQLPAPDGSRVPLDIPGAKQVIDILTMLEKKTTGNLDPEESKLFQDILHGVRMSFLQMTTK